jgi:broad specificity phosphatase PhoE
MADHHRMLIMRHPQTVANVERVLSGRSDVELSEEGYRQFRRAADALVVWKPDRIWTSPLSRCRSLGEAAAARLGIACEVCPELIEIEFGPVQGMTVAELKQLGYDFPWAHDESGKSIAPEGAESFEALFARARQLLDMLKEQEGRTACITHGGVLRALLREVFQTPLSTFWNVRLPNVSSQILACDSTTVTLEAVALAPEEVIRRIECPELRGIDTTSAADLHSTRVRSL